MGTSAVEGRTWRVDTVRFIVTVISSLYFIHAVLQPETWRFLDTVNLVFHEAGHPLFALFGPFMHAFGGSLMQVAVPLLCAAALYRQKDIWAASLVLLWCAQSIANVSVYIADARAMALPLLGGEDVSHDWNVLLEMSGLLAYDILIGALVRLLTLALALIATYVALRSTLHRHAPA